MCLSTKIFSGDLDAVPSVKGRCRRTVEAPIELRRTPLPVSEGPLRPVVALPPTVALTVRLTTHSQWVCEEP